MSQVIFSLPREVTFICSTSKESVSWHISDILVLSDRDGVMVGEMVGDTGGVNVGEEGWLGGSGPPWGAGPPA